MSESDFRKALRNYIFSFLVIVITGIGGTMFVAWRSIPTMQNDINTLKQNVNENKISIQQINQKVISKDEFLRSFEMLHDDIQEIKAVVEKIRDKQ